MDEFDEDASSRGPSKGERLRDIPFAKMTGSGNDFVFFDGRVAPVALLASPDVIAAICNRFNGIGADGLVVLEPLTPDDASGADARIRYFNSDGSAADLCGNATLCSTRLAVELGMAQASSMGLLTPAGVIRGRLDSAGPEIDLPAVTAVRTNVDGIALGPGERQIGYATAGIPHVVVLSTDAESIDLVGRGPALRQHPVLGAAGANVNWVSPLPDGSWRYRTFERGVEGETLACGTGAVATAVLLVKWGLAAAPVVIRTSSGRDLTVQLRGDQRDAKPELRAERRYAMTSEVRPDAGSEAGAEVVRGEGAGGPLETSADSARFGWWPSLRGEGRVVFHGRIATLDV